MRSQCAFKGGEITLIKIHATSNSSAQNNCSFKVHWTWGMKKVICESLTHKLNNITSTIGRRIREIKCSFETDTYLNATYLRFSLIFLWFQDFFFLFTSFLLISMSLSLWIIVRKNKKKMKRRLKMNT